ncbi:glycosyltransferase [Spirosoma sp. KCTC 42546]|uniref:glycosyltransferase n=1 Tax=Spirosoma sp. KCTC 42546 TaxID=2520506 RepID=UPI0011581F44|nr:glycosyltransferase [Spirosoma sp. KCTC 42546]QDK79697.1 glycosyltransferase [Spirosoma sp. KCTC 42546]
MNWQLFTQPSPNEAYNFSFKKSDKRPIRILISVGLLFIVAFLWVYLKPENRGYSWLFAMLTVSVTFKLLRLLHEWYHYWNVVPATPPAVTRIWSVDIFTTFCPGEPYEMVLNSLRAIQAIPYPHTTYLCDEADDPYLRQVCEQMGIRHVTRTDKKDAKAGNINNALQLATGDICVILDPDHVAVPDFLDHVLPYFEDPTVGFVQCVQAYYNYRESLVAFGAAEQTYTFYGPMMTCMGTYGTAQAIGANCTFRRAALDSIGGHAAGLSEDMHTAMQLHAKGWRSAYVPLPLSYGLVPATLSAYYKQQLKWARGTFELLVTTYPSVFGQLSWRQRLHYLTMPLYYLLGIVQLIDILIPIISLVTMRLPLKLDLLVFGTAYAPLLITAFLIRQYAQRWLIEKHEAGFHTLGGVLSSGTWWVYFLGFIYTIFRVEVPYLPTPKRDKPQNNFILCLPNLLLLLITVVAIGYSTYHYGRFAVSNIYSELMITFAILNAYILSLNVLIGQEKVLGSIKNWIAKMSFQKPIVWPLRIAVWQIRYGLYSWIRLSAIPLFGGLLIITTGLVAYTSRKKTTTLPREVRYATTQPFYYGLEKASQPAMLAAKQEKPITLPNQIISPQHLTWTFSSKGGSAIMAPNWPVSQNQLPLIYLEPSFAETRTSSHRSEAELQLFLRNITKGEYNGGLRKLASELKRYQEPVLVSFAPEFDDTTNSWGTRQESTLVRYKQAWQYIVRFIKQEKVDNVIWVWCPIQPSTVVSHYPGTDSVDWLGLEIMNNPATDVDHQSHSFASLYQLIHNTIRLHLDYSIRQKPILVTHFGAITLDSNEQVWVRDAVDIISERYPEIRGVVLTPEQAKAIQE